MKKNQAANKRRELHLKRRAMKIAEELPENAEEARIVLRFATELLENFLEGGCARCSGSAATLRLVETVKPSV